MPAILGVDFSEIYREINETISEGLSAAREALSTVAGKITAIIKFVLSKLWENIILPVGMTGINVLGYSLDKILLGPPGLRRFLAGGVFPNDIPQDYRDWVANNTGWDIYSTVEGPIDNTLGFCLGGGIGFLNTFSHLLSSVIHNVRNFHNLLGDNGVYGPKPDNNDERNTVVRVIFGILTAPIVLPIVAVTNWVNLNLTFLKHLGLSIARNIRATYNLLGTYGMLGPRLGLEDGRHLAVKIVFGILTLPIVLPAMAITNASDLILTTFKHISLSVGYNIACTANLLGEHGVFGPKPDYQDDRHLALKIIFGVVTLPVVLPLVAISNCADLFCTTLWHLGHSIARNVRRTFNLLGSHGIMGERLPYEDDRHLALKIIFGVATLPVVLPLAAITNCVDLFCTTLWHLGHSIARNVRCTFNLLGSHGIMGERAPYEDDRHLAIRIPAGLVTLPVVAAISLCTNTLDAIFTFIKHLGLSIAQNFVATHNLLGDNGVFGARKGYHDDRHLAVRIIFGLLTAPVVIPLITMSNFADLVGTVCKNSLRSIYHNIRCTFNLLLGSQGVFGDRNLYEDDRHMALKIIFGVITAPVVIAVSSLTNSLDVVSTTIKHLSLSIAHNIKSTFNLLGTYGVMGERQPYDDDRHLAVRIIFGLVTMPVVATISALTNMVDAALTILKHTGLSIGRNIAATYHLLGSYGVFGRKEAYQDDRHIATKTIFGILTAPLVVPVVAITNLADILFTTSMHLGLSIGRNVKSTFNLLLGQHGVLGERKPYADDRHLAVKIIAGIVTAPIVAAVSLVTNVVDLGLSWFRELGFSIGRNIAATYNLLGENGVFGPKAAYQDARHIALKVVFGVLTAPIVLPIVAITNLADLVLTACKNTGLSISHNISCTYNFLGESGVFGPRQPYVDDRHIAIRVLFGIITAPVVACVSALTNAIDCVATALNKTLFNPEFLKRSAIILIGVPTVAVTALPAFLIRKTFKGLYNCTLRPCLDGREKSLESRAKDYASGLANVATLGTFGLLKKVFKGITGYTSRFGFPNSSPDIVDREYTNAMSLFKRGIHFAARGTFPGVADGQGIFRPLMRLFYKMRHTSEKVIKEFHNAYLDYIAAGREREDGLVNYSLASFFASPRCQEAERKSREQIASKAGEEGIVDAVKVYLSEVPQMV